MPNYFNLTLDTLAPAGVTISINGGAQYATAQLVNVAIATSDTTTTSYQMKIFGDLDLAQAKTDGLVLGAATTTDEASAQWVTFVAAKQLKLSSGDGSKSITVQVRDDVWNVSSSATDAIVLDMTRPIVTISGPDVTKISRVSGKDKCAFSFTVNEDYVEYKVKIVASTGAAENTGTQIPITGGSVNMSATGTFTKDTPIECIIDGDDLFTAQSGDGVKIIKVFVHGIAGNWSI